MRPRSLAYFGRAAAVAVATALLYGWSNRFSAVYFRVSPDLSLVFPASGIGVAAAFLFGLPAAAGVALGTLATPWHPRMDVSTVLFAVVNAFEAAFPFLVFRLFSASGVLERQDRQLRTARGRLVFFASGVVVNTLLSALAGNAIARVSASSPPASDFVHDVRIWWVGDAAAVMLLGWPALELGLTLLRARRAAQARQRHPRLVDGERPIALGPVPGRELVWILFAGWAMFAFILLLSGASVPAGQANVLFDVPILLSAYLFGFRGGLVAGAVAGWVALLGSLGVPAGTEVVVDTSVAAFERVGLGVLTGGLFEAKRRIITQMRSSYASLRRDLAYVAGVLTAAVESRDPSTEGHMQRVAVYASRIARRLGMGEEEVESTRLAALLHDVGKIGVPDSILFKTQPLDAGELEVMRAHAEAGAMIASRASILAATVAAIEAHHERWDGRRDGPRPGYPRGLRGEQIPMAARIIAVADAYDAMTTTHPYRAAIPPERALAVLQDERGAQFDPRVVDAFLEDVTARRHRRASGIFRIPSLARGAPER